EARALSDIGRHDVALEVIANLNGREAIRLRSDILWAAKRWNEASEQIELLYGERWRDSTPLSEGERADILRAAIGYALAEEPISLQRFRDKYAAKMTDGADHRAFDIVSGPIGTNSSDFQDVAKTVASVDTLGAFLADMRARYPDSAALPPGPPPADPQKPQAAAPKPAAPIEAANAAPKKPAAASSPLPPKAPQGVPLKPDPAPTGSIPRLPKLNSIAR
ncbi:MAG TPA: hypothetical protein VHV58_02870, partial [Pseudolabrys sp.]|nr:hypothetical protein [Pseudolabrys sp.]